MESVRKVSTLVAIERLLSTMLLKQMCFEAIAQVGGEIALNTSVSVLGLYFHVWSFLLNQWWNKVGG